MEIGYKKPIRSVTSDPGKGCVDELVASRTVWGRKASKIMNRNDLFSGDRLWIVHRGE